MDNPLLKLQQSQLPAFSKILPEHIEPALDQTLAQNHAELSQLLSQSSEPTWDNFMHPLEDMNTRLNHLWGIATHLTYVCDSKPLREAYHQCLPKITTYTTEFRQNESIYHAVKKISESQSFKNLSHAQKKVIQHLLRDFKLTGVDLPELQKKRLREINTELAYLTHKFEENVLDATSNWTYHVTQKQDLAGVPEVAIAQAADLAKEKNLAGWVLTLEYPCYHAIVTYAEHRELREKIHTAFVTRASDQGPQAGRWDNSTIMKTILNLRKEEAEIVGFANFAELSLATNKMVKHTQTVMDFLNEIAQKAKPIADAEWKNLKIFAKKEYGIENLQPWDIAYYSEKLRLHDYAINQEELRRYFPEEKVIQGLFSIVEKLFDIHIQEKHGFNTWHEDVRYFEIYTRAGQLQAGFYFDLHARSTKRGGAWMGGCNDKHQYTNGYQQLPIAFVNCNFMGPTGDTPALLTHDEVLTLLHEFGHALHHMLTKINFASVSGTNGVDWDVVEFPSQMMEHWGWAKASLDLLSQHYQSDAPLPDEMFGRLTQAKNFHAGLQIVRQLEFALFDFRIHLEHDPKNPRIQSILNEVRQQVGVVPVLPFNRFQHSFSHIFGDSYAAGYYSYKWAEVMACDAFTKFEEEGLFNPKTGQQYLHTILEKGGSEDPMEQFIAFRGRPPKIDALLHYYGMNA